jgi:hypothetical protein
MPVEARPMTTEQAVEDLLAQRERLGISWLLDNFGFLIILRTTRASTAIKPCCLTSLCDS